METHEKRIIRTVRRGITGLRKDRDISVSEMASDFNVSEQTIYNWQSNPKSLNSDQIIDICIYFGITANEFLGLEVV